MACVQDVAGFPIHPWMIFLPVVPGLTSLSHAFLCWGCRKEFLITHRTVYILHFIEEKCIYHRITAKCIFINWTHLVTRSQIKKTDYLSTLEISSCSLLVTGGLGGMVPSPKDNTGPDISQQRLVLLGFILYINRTIQCVLFCVWFLSFNTLSVRLIHIVVYSFTS